ncbi:unnamed protein product [Larinioides sclopetarius]|uniref:Uncharacterized protein n=1 Tax=Larinioides sclopetarius TaxID=280406 RepID=A0AAV1ZMU8_9ARAC
MCAREVFLITLASKSIFVNIKAIQNIFVTYAKNVFSEKSI